MYGSGLWDDAYIQMLNPTIMSRLAIETVSLRWFIYLDFLGH